MTSHHLAPRAPRRQSAVTALLGVLAFLSVPFVVTGLFRLDLTDNLVASDPRGEAAYTEGIDTVEEVREAAAKPR